VAAGSSYKAVSFIWPQKSPLRITGQCPGFALCLALRSAISHCSRLYSSALWSAKTLLAILKLLCIKQRKAMASPVRKSSCAGDLQIGHESGIGYFPTIRLVLTWINAAVAICCCDHSRADPRCVSTTTWATQSVAFFFKDHKTSKEIH